MNYCAKKFKAKYNILCKKTKEKIGDGVYSVREEDGICIIYYIEPDEWSY